MDPIQNYLEINRESWNARTEFHVDSEFYDMPGFLSGSNSLKSVELKLLGDVRGKSILHLQCHFGQDSLSMARMGAKVCGVDLSDKAIHKARQLAGELQLNAEFICCDVYNLPTYLDKQFDIVFTTYGTIGWLPDLHKWASIIKRYLKPGASLIFVDFHPVLWMYDNQFENLAYDYFNTGAIVEAETGTYAQPEAPIVHHSVGWNHSLGEVLGCLLSQGLQLTSFDEYDYSPYNCFSNMVQYEPGKFRIQNFKKLIPMVYSLSAINP